MAKKKKSIQKQHKKQQLQELTKGPTDYSSHDLPSATVIEDKNPKPSKVKNLSTDQELVVNHQRELIKTLLSVSVIVVIFATTLYLDRSKHFLDPLGDKLYQQLQLDQ